MEKIIVKNNIKIQIQNFFNGTNLFLMGVTVTGAFDEVLLEK